MKTAKQTLFFILLFFFFNISCMRFIKGDGTEVIVYQNSSENTDTECQSSDSILYNSSMMFQLNEKQKSEIKMPQSFLDTYIKKVRQQIEKDFSCFTKTAKDQFKILNDNCVKTPIKAIFNCLFGIFKKPCT